MKERITDSHERRLNMHRCLVALRLLCIDELLPIAESNEHAFAKDTICGQQPARRLHMMTTSNTRRLIHVYLWWTFLFGPNFPVSDILVRAPFWKYLRNMCGFGILNAKGQHAYPNACINPRHYHLMDSFDVYPLIRKEMTALINDARTDAVWQTSAEIQIFVSQLSDKLKEPLSIEQLALFIREKCPVFPGRTLGAHIAISMEEHRWKALQHQMLPSLVPPVLYPPPPPIPVGWVPIGFGVFTHPYNTIIPARIIGLPTQ